MKITKEELVKKTDLRWHDRIGGLLQNFWQLEPGKLPVGWFARSWLMDVKFYNMHREAIGEALAQGFIFDDTMDEIKVPFPK